jgi:aryl-alcohol dehydrogenase-like predicted oxidoreductase
MKCLPTVVLGKTGVTVTRLGLGGEGVLRTFGQETDAVPLIQRALDLGITYFDSARAYAGSEEYYGIALGKRRDGIFLCSKTHDRTKKGSKKFLETTLKNMKTNHLDLWQFHDIRTEQDLIEAASPGGCFEAFDEAKKAGLVRFIGITGHYDPHILVKGMELYSFDTLLMPVNPCEPHYLSFLHIALPEARKRRMGIIGMKVLKPFFWWNGKSFTVSELLRFALSQDVDLVITGCDSIPQLEENFSIVSDFQPLTQHEQDALLDKGKKLLHTMIYKKGIGN